MDTDALGASSFLHSSVITPIEVALSSNRPMAWHAYSDLNDFPAPRLAESPAFAPKCVLPTPQVLQQDSFAFADCHSTYGPARHRESISSSSGSSVCEPTSPMEEGPLSSVPIDNVTMPSDADTDDAPWNLVAYHIPWGPDYEGYRAGTLPGPDGTCIFLRSPTPLKRQRTSQACEKCRERKAKCSGARPSCARCQSRGLACVYSTPVPDSQPQLQSSSRRPSHSALNSPIKHQHLRGSARHRMRRKSSRADSEVSLGSNSAQETSPSLEAGVDRTTLVDDLSRDMDYNLSRKYPCLPLIGDEFASQVGVPSSPTSATSFSTAFADTHSPPQVSSSLFRPRDLAFPGGTSVPLYADSLSGLDCYRFPPLEDVKDITINHPRPQIPNCSAAVTQMSHSLSASTVHDDHTTCTIMPDLPVNGELDTMWHGAGLAEDAGNQCYLSSLHSLSDKSIKPVYFSPHLQHEEGSFTAYRTIEQYEVMPDAYLSQHTLQLQRGP